MQERATWLNVVIIFFFECGSTTPELSMVGKAVSKVGRLPDNLALDNLHVEQLVNEFLMAAEEVHLLVLHKGLKGINDARPFGLGSWFDGADREVCTTFDHLALEEVLQSLLE